MPRKSIRCIDASGKQEVVKFIPEAIVRDAELMRRLKLYVAEPIAMEQVGVLKEPVLTQENTTIKQDQRVESIPEFNETAPAKRGRKPNQ